MHKNNLVKFLPIIDRCCFVVFKIFKIFSIDCTPVGYPTRLFIALLWKVFFRLFIWTTQWKKIKLNFHTAAPPCLKSKFFRHFCEAFPSVNVWTSSHSFQLYSLRETGANRLNSTDPFCPLYSVSDIVCLTWFCREGRRSMLFCLDSLRFFSCFIFEYTYIFTRALFANVSFLCSDFLNE